MTYRRSDNGNQIEFHYPCIMSFFFLNLNVVWINVHIDTISLSIYNTSYLSPTGKYYLPINKYEQQSIKLFLHHTLLVASILCFVLSANSVKIVSLCMTNVILHDQWRCHTRFENKTQYWHIIPVTIKYLLIHDLQ